MNRTSKTRAAAGAVGLGSALLLAALGASSYPGCAVYSQSLIGSAEQGDTGSIPMPDAGAMCMSWVPPTRPTVAGDAGISGGDLGPLVAAFETIDIGVSGPIDAGIPPFGYNLDNTCTCPGPPSCLQRTDAGAGQDCDDPQGRDNLDIQLFRLLRGPASTGTNQIDQGLKAGQYGLLLVIRNYNGAQDDASVTVEFYVSNGLDRDADGGVPTPNFDGNDRWTIDPLSVNGGKPGGAPLYVDDQAYVTDYKVVAHPANAIPIAFGDRTFLGGATMVLTNPIIVGTLKASALGDGGGGLGFSLVSGTIAGRWSTSQILSTLATIPEEGGTFLCPREDPLKYDIIKQVVCSVADISTNQSQDNSTPLAPCDAISVGMQFTAAPAQLGDVFGVDPAPSGCMSDSGVAFSDTCSQ